MGRSIESLPPEQRALHYRDSAAEAFRLAESSASPGLRAAYMNVATGWHSMALELEFLLTSDRFREESFEDFDRAGG